MTQEMIQAFKPCIRSMLNRYQDTQLRISSTTDPGEIKQMALRYIEVFQEKGVDRAVIERHAMDALNRPEFSEHPPRPARLAELIITLSRYHSHEDHQRLEAAALLYRAMKLRYRHLWYDDSVQDEVIDQWVDFCQRHDVPAQSIEQSVTHIQNSLSYHRYPPSQDQMESIFLIMIRDPSIPEPEQAYFMAMEGEEGMHPLVRYTKQMFGSYRLKTRTDRGVKSEFEALFRRYMSQYLMGDLSLAQYQQRTEPKETSPEALMGRSALKDLLQSI